ncbi:hypothetical protein B0I35DRAFT_436361 [Stachybotrys elegans]|uniref:Uncharacterized protein n=1 Tax=Stachybotrys elegans TaxID=80388 RepID=A0A8K0SJJ7_9HYPO|nr:hypothetical protein B0I35DRAFT_436361 [Stachybotrys elegans]
MSCRSSKQENQWPGHTHARVCMHACLAASPTRDPWLSIPIPSFSLAVKKRKTRKKEREKKMDALLSNEAFPPSRLASYHSQLTTAQSLSQRRIRDSQQSPSRLSLSPALGPSPPAHCATKSITYADTHTDPLLPLPACSDPPAPESVRRPSAPVVRRTLITAGAACLRDPRRTVRCPGKQGWPGTTDVMMLPRRACRPASIRESAMASRKPRLMLDHILLP